MSSEILLGAEGLGVQVGARNLLQGVGFSLSAGECLTVLGESGAGKSLLAQAVMGTLPSALAANGRVVLNGATSDAADTKARRPHWGRRLAMLPQEPSTALDPLMRVGPQLAEIHQFIGGETREVAAKSARNGLEQAGLADAAQLYPWQISGGMAQRAAGVMALAGGAQAVIVDEPTKGLDARWREEMTELLRGVMAAGGCVIVVTHDLRVARALGGQILVLRDGQMVEAGETRAVLDAPRHAFTRDLVAADPSRWPMRAAQPAGDVVLRGEGLAMGFGDRVLFEGLDIEIRRRDHLAIQGPSGVGKSTLGNVLLGLAAPRAGRVVRAEGLPAIAFQKLYQDPVASFPPHQALGRTLQDVVRRHGRAFVEVEALLMRLGIPGDLLARRPSEISGGELQRIALARVLTVQPAFIFADEPTSRLDPLTQKTCMEVLMQAIADSGAGLALVTHDDDIARATCSRTLVLS